MTAEIGILNRQGIALAADSAVTISSNGNEKILNSANKLFNLIKGKPIGFMVYGNGFFMGLPWDVIVDNYRKNFNTEISYNSLESICDDFINHLSTNTDYHSENSCDKLIFDKLSVFIYNIILETQDTLSERYPDIRVNTDQVLNAFDEKLEFYNRNYSNQPYSIGFDENDFHQIYNRCESIVVDICNIYIEFNLNNEIIDKIKQISANLMTKDILFNFSGIVIAGYGEDDILPRLYHYRVEGIVNEKLKYTIEPPSIIHQTDYNNGNTAEIIPFAQQEMVHSILTGMDPNLQDFLMNNISDKFNNISKVVNNGTDDIFNSFVVSEFNKLENEIREFQQNVFASPILNMVAMLNKEELAIMAENLVNITSFKRKFTTDSETVGGPIDVAVISKSEGFIWIKRKHYFNRELNPGYLNSNRY